LFSEYKRSADNDYFIASIRKWLSLPSGGFLASPSKPISNNLQHDNVFPNIRKEAMYLKAQYMRTYNKTSKSRYLELFDEGETVLNNLTTPCYIDELSIVIVNDLDVENLRSKRKANFSMLCSTLSNIEYIHPIFETLSNDVCPFFFPIYLDTRRSQIRQKLADNHIYCPIHWPIPAQLEIRDCGNLAYIYNSILSIPCDQRYGLHDMEKIVSVLRTI
jgi:hypothetical protein